MPADADNGCMPFGPSETIRAAVEKLIAAGSGFVIFDDGKEDEYVQFSLEPKGLMFNWPTMLPSYQARLEDVAALLGEFEFHEASADHDVGTYEVAEEGIYAQFGKDVDRIERFTLESFRRLFAQSEWLKLNANVEE